MCESPILIRNQETKEEITVACGRCILCRRKKCRNWAIRLINESKYHKKMSMITLTFRPRFLLRPRFKTLTKYHTYKRNGEKIRIKEKYETMISPKYITDVKLTGWLVTLFMKKLRKKLQKKGIYISFFAVGEHGTKNTHRAHWHIILFGAGKEELESVNIGKSRKNKDIYFSPIINDCWNYDKMSIGTHTVSDVTGATIKYVSNYTMKKMYKDYGKNKQYRTIMRFSNQNKIGIKWARRYHKELRKGYLLDDDNQKYAIPNAYYLEMKRYENLLSNASMTDTAEIIEQNKDEMIKKLMKNGLLSLEEMKKKAKRLLFYYSRQERDTG